MQLFSVENFNHGLPLFVCYEHFLLFASIHLLWHFQKSFPRNRNELFSFFVCSMCVVCICRYFEISNIHSKYRSSRTREISDGSKAQSTRLDERHRIVKSKNCFVACRSSWIWMKFETFLIKIIWNFLLLLFEYIQKKSCWLLAIVKYSPEITKQRKQIFVNSHRHRPHHFYHCHYSSWHSLV